MVKQICLYEFDGLKVIVDGNSYTVISDSEARLVTKYELLALAAHSIRDSDIYQSLDLINAIKSEFKPEERYLISVVEVHLRRLLTDIFGKKVVKTKTLTYLMKDETNGYVKIGKSVNPKFRERTLQSQCPTISLMFIHNGDIEKTLHKLYAKQRYRGEWFDLSDDQIESIINTYNFYEP